jgi:2-polyprenyl-3-methyl-5-hydroxy-6-metoxy-1,4-benzoquinol methylase
VQDELRLSVRNQGSVQLASRRGVRGLVLELLMPDGERRSQVISIDPETDVTVALASGNVRTALTRDQLWRSQGTPILAEAVRSYYAQEGINPRADEVKATVETNTIRVPSRVRTILDHASELRGSDSLAGLRILDVGCGFGAFAAYLALDPDAPSVTAIDIRADFIATAGDVGRRLGLDNLEFAVADARALGGLGAERFDVVVVNNSFIYLTTAADMLRALDEIVAVTAPGGAIVFHHANRWALRDPFTRSPLVHLLPAGLAERVSRRTGWRHSHGRVRLVSAPWLVRQLRARGIEAVTTHPRGGWMLPPRGWFARFYAVRGRKR